MSASPKQPQETPSTPVFYSVGRAEDVGCYTGENLPQDAQQRIRRQRRHCQQHHHCRHHHTSLSDGVSQVDALSRLLSARARGDTRAERFALRRLEAVLGETGLAIQIRNAQRDFGNREKIPETHKTRKRSQTENRT